MKVLFLIYAALLAGGTNVAVAQSSFSSQVDSTSLAARPDARPEPVSSTNFRFQRYKWDVSVDASFVLPSIYQVSYGYGFYTVYDPFFYGSWSGPTSSRSTRFMVRRNETVMTRTNIPVRKGAYRMSLHLDGLNSRVSKDSIRFNNPSYRDAFLFPVSQNSFNASVAVGYEWQHQMGRFQFIYGYNMFVNGGANRETGTWRTSEGLREDYTSTARYVGIGLGPLAGVKFFIHSRFSLSLEGAYTVAYNHRRFESTITSYTYVVRNATMNSISYGLTPISAFNATFHFGRRVNP
ncbi:hypothetical protein FY528_04175 [Hymenobacter lutimineralis]|uniref:DUF4421 domain-containing protein n=1 Tax=Hymenobacter lutimineralis TaxID=2606448 RepID=A0A5D6V955_9BACT|nr:hypothetical protein [Hymenobacter lutimineralis]TYZ12501.1 hypothetical protein FY528_04175 [Hymenobacter lutimineralis]